QAGVDGSVVEDLEPAFEDLDRVHAVGVVREPGAEAVVVVAAGDPAAVGLERFLERGEPCVVLVFGVGRITGRVDVDRPPLLHGGAAYVAQLTIASSTWSRPPMT